MRPVSTIENAIDRAPGKYELKSGTRRSPRPDYSTGGGSLEAQRDSRGTREERDRADVLSVALVQPHRRGAADPRDEMLGTALGRFCASARLPHASKRGLGHSCWQAGEQYRQVAEDARRALGLDSVHCWAPGDSGYEEPTLEEARARADLARKRLDEARAVIAAIRPRMSPGVMERLVCEDLDPPPHDERVIVTALVELAFFWSYLKIRPEIGA